MPAKTTMPRILALDLARSAALVCMAVFHFTLDLEMFGHLPQGTVQQPFWHYLARFTAGSFLFLAGVSLVLAHGQTIRWRAFWQRFGIIAVAATAVTVGTYLYIPQGVILFGVLHAIAISSVIGLLFLRLPRIVTLVVAAAVFVLPWVWQHPAFNGISLLWLGLSTEKPWMMDYVPIFPWLAPFLLGMAVRVPWPHIPPSRLVCVLAFPGQHSLIVYLIHQPILIALIWGFTTLSR